MSKQRVLVCDDDDLVRAVVGDIIEANGYEVVAVSRGQDAVDALTTGDFACAFLDIDLPDMKGFEVARIVRAAPLPRRPRLVALTGRVSSRDFTLSREVGFDLHLLKPASWDQIVVALATLRVTPTERPEPHCSTH
jgi:CheY-like chemotaxis protein